MSNDHKLKTINDRILERRRLLKLSQADLAKAIGASQSAVAHWETKRQGPTIEYLPALSAVLECSLEWLLTGASSPEQYMETVVRPIARRLAELKGEKPHASEPFRALTPIQNAFLATVTSALVSGRVPDADCVRELAKWHALAEGGPAQ